MEPEGHKGVNIRTILESDVEAVIQIEAAAFGEWWRSVRGPGAMLAPRTRQNVLSRLARDPQGCFVAEEEGRPVGFIFSCTWGRVGWFGTFAVRPEHQGRGLGQALLSASLDYLRREPQRTIGLETMPESAANMGLYLKMGFQPRRLNLLLARPVEPSHSDELPRWSAADPATRARWLAELQAACGAIYPGLDWSKEILLTEQFGIGETLVLLASGRAVGLSVVALAGTRENFARERAHVQALALHPDHTDTGTFCTLLAASESLAAAQGKAMLTVSCYSAHTWALQHLLSWGYRVERGLLRMVLAGRDEGPAGEGQVELARWAG